MFHREQHNFDLTSVDNCTNLNRQMRSCLLPYCEQSICPYHLLMRHYIDRRVTPPKRVNSPTWGGVRHPHVNRPLVMNLSLATSTRIGTFLNPHIFLSPRFLWTGPYPRRLESPTVLQMSLQRQHFLLSYSKTLGVGPTGVRTCEVPLSRPALSQLSQPGGSTVMYSICTAVNSSAERCMHGSL